MSRHRCISVEVKLPVFGGVAVQVSTYYAPPTSSAPALDAALLESLLQPRSRALLLGDLNARHRDLGCRGDNVNGVVLRDFLDASDSVPLNDASLPTFFHTGYDHRDCIDWALATESFASLPLVCETGEDIGSDHLPLLLRPSMTPLTACPPFPFPRWRLREADWQQFQQELTRQVTSDPSLWPPHKPNTPAALDTAAAQIEASLRNAADKVFVRQQSHTFRRDRPSLPLEVRWLIAERKRLRRCDASGHPGLRPVINRLRAEIRIATKNAKKELAEEEGRRLSSGPRHEDFWPRVKAALSPSSNQPIPPMRRTADSGDPAVTDNQQRADLFAVHLQSTMANIEGSSRYSEFQAQVSESISSCRALHPLPSCLVPPDADQMLPPEQPRWITVDQEHDPFAALPPELDPTQEWIDVPPASPRSGSSAQVEDLVVREINPHELMKMGQRLRRRKAPGEDGIANELLQNAPYPFFACLSAVFSSSLTLGHIPVRWKRGVVKMIPKAGKDLSVCGHCRPIFLNSAVGKLLERLVAKRLLAFAESHELLPQAQSAFRGGRNAVEQVALLCQEVTKAMNAQLTTAVLALDVARAFDSVWHDGLRTVVKDLLPLPTARWISSFLRDRELRVIEGSFLSAPFRPEAGVPQGSPISPLLFSLYVRGAPLPTGSSAGATVFADDHAMWATGRSPRSSWSHLRPHVCAFADWCDRWRLQLNASKSQLTFFTRRNTWRDEDYPRARFLDADLARSPTLDLLGVKLDQRLTFGPHCQALRQRLQPRVLQVRRLLANRAIRSWVGSLIYRTCIRPCMTYGAPVMLMAANTTWEILERIEHAALRAALRVPVGVPLPQLHARSRVPYLRDVYKDSSSSFLLWCERNRNIRILGALGEGVRVQHRAFWLPPLNRALRLLPPADQDRIQRTAAELSGPPALGQRNRALPWRMSQLPGSG